MFGSNSGWPGAYRACRVAGFAFVALSAATLTAPMATMAQTQGQMPSPSPAMTEQQMIDRLLGKTSRGATSSVASTSQPSDVARLRSLLDKAGTRAFTAKERVEVAEKTKDRPDLDFEIYFPFNSSSLQKAAMETMQQIGKLMANPAFEGRGFLIAGHTDAKGKPEANIMVSQRRAQSVKAYLVKTYGIDPNRLRVIGYGKEQLKLADQPNSAINRRVQIINLPDGTLTASR